VKWSAAAAFLASYLTGTIPASSVEIVIANRGSDTMSGIFICYRHDDNSHAAGRLYESLQRCFSSDQIFFDVDKIEPGLNFLTVIREKIAASDAILVVIGPNWLNSRDSVGQRRLDSPKDFIRLEIEEGLEQGIRVIPLLIDGAEMPTDDDLPASLKSLALLNAVPLSKSSFRRDVEHLNAALLKVVNSKSVRPGHAVRKTRKRKLDPSKRPPKKWKAEFLEQGRSFFIIRLYRGVESHVLKLHIGPHHLAEKLELNGIVVEKFWTGGSKTVNFRVDSHANQFQLTFNMTASMAGILQRLSVIRLLVDNQLILSSD
jgi:hypothetical protein